MAAAGLLSLFGGARRALTGSAKASDLFRHTTPEVDGDDCAHDCSSCTVKYPRSFKVEQTHPLYGNLKPFSTHVLVATSKSDWLRDVEDERGSVMEAFGKAGKPSNGRLMLSASNMHTPSNRPDYSEPTTVMVLPAFTMVENVTPAGVPSLISDYISRAPTTSDSLEPANTSLPTTIPVSGSNDMRVRPCPHSAVVLLCSHRTRDARCGQSAPLIKKELERHLRALGLDRDLDDERPGGVGVYFVNHVGGHKYSANMLVYRRPDAFGLDAAQRGQLPPGETLTPIAKPEAGVAGEEGEGKVEGADGKEEKGVVGAAQCIWLARVRPEDCENIVKYTILQGKVVKPDKQLRGGFDRGTGLMSW
ncbi:actin patches distal protein [Hypoxylon sp. FL1284]|nr:actin patches distal protein [Hypoxylon sp. FL1284]